MRILTYVLIIALPLSCHKRKPVPSDSEIFSDRKALAELTDKNLEEVSGLAASANNPGLFWAHNDSGNGPEVFLIDEKLKIKLTCKIQGVKNRDWEDIAVGPGPEEGKNYVYVADIGDNNANYSFKYIYRFEEPVLDKQSGEITIVEFDKIVFRLEDGKKDTEAIMIHPKTKDLYFVSKRERPVYLYELKFPYSVHDTLTAAKITSIPFALIVAACISTDGKEIVMKDYDNVYYWETNGKSIPDAVKAKPQILQYTAEYQGEAITFARDGSGFYTLSETSKEEKTYLYFYERRKR